MATLSGVLHTRVYFCGIWCQKCKILVRASLTSLDLSRNELEAEAAKALAPALAANGSLTKASLKYNNLTDDTKDMLRKGGRDGLVLSCDLQSTLTQHT